MDFSVKNVISGDLLKCRGKFVTAYHDEDDSEIVIVSPVEQADSLIKDKSWIIFTPNSEESKREIGIYTGQSYGLCYKKSNGETGVWRLSQCCKVIALEDHLPPIYRNRFVANDITDGQEFMIECIKKDDAYEIKIINDHINILESAKMSKEDYSIKLNSVRKECLDRIHELNKSYVERNAEFKIGDIIRNVTGMIKIERIGYKSRYDFNTMSTRSDVPLIIYTGPRLKKLHGKIVPIKNGEKGELSNISSLILVKE